MILHNCLVHLPEAISVPVYIVLCFLWASFALGTYYTSNTRKLDMVTSSVLDIGGNICFTCHLS